MLMTIMMGGLFVLKFHRESEQTEYALKLEALVDESKFDESMSWKLRRHNYFQALALMDEAQEKRVDLGKLLKQVTEAIEVPEAYRPVLAASLTRNYELALELKLLTGENMARLEAGGRLKIGAGGNVGEFVVLDNIVPYRYSPELEMRYANLLLKPESIARRYPDEMGEGAVLVMNACRSAQLMTEVSYVRAMRAAQH
jgi:hypothetical protein